MLYLNGKYILKSRDITLPTKVHLSQGYGFSSSHVWMWELDYKESWALKNWCFWTVVLEKTLESLLDCKEIQPVHPKGDQFWVFIRRTDVEAELEYFGCLMQRADSFEKTLMLGGIVGRRRRGRQRMRWLDGITDLMWVWVNSGSWWWTGRPGMLQFMGSQRVGHDWATELRHCLSTILSAFHIFSNLILRMTLKLGVLLCSFYRSYLPKFIQLVYNRVRIWIQIIVFQEYNFNSSAGIRVFLSVTLFFHWLRSFFVFCF